MLYNVKFSGTVEITEANAPAPVDPGDNNPTPVPPASGIKVGVNSFPWFPLRLLQSIGMPFHRCYLSSGWIWQPGGLAVQPMHQAETAETHGIDEMLTRAKSMGIETLLCIHQTPEWFRNTGRQDGNNDLAPVKGGANRTDPASYADYARFLFQVAARYGAVAHSDSTLKVDTTPRWSGDVLNEKKTGLSLLKYMEPWNEPDKWWKKGTAEKDAYFEPEEAAALLSACYDGHEGKLGEHAGIKVADPAMCVVMPGITDFDVEYMQRMGAWFTANRKDKAWPCDVINVHHYSNLGNKSGQLPAQWVASGACLPKDDKGFGMLQGVIGIAKKHALPVWVTEFGADKKAPSMMHAKAAPGSTDEQFQAEIIIASIKAYEEAGVDACFIFNAPDENSGADGGQFETCGIFTSEASGYKPTMAATALAGYFKQKTALAGLFKASASKRR